MKIRLTIRNKKNGRAYGSEIFREYEIDTKKEIIAKREAELKYLNERRDKNSFPNEFTELNLAKKMVSLSITSSVINEKRKS